MVKVEKRCNDDWLRDRSGYPFFVLPLPAGRFEAKKDSNARPDEHRSDGHSPIKCLIKLHFLQPQIFKKIILHVGIAKIQPLQKNETKSNNIAWNTKTVYIVIN
jgi:hypothetical protein